MHKNFDVFIFFYYTYYTSLTHAGIIRVIKKNIKVLMHLADLADFYRNCFYYFVDKDRQNRTLMNFNFIKELKNVC